MKVKLLRDVWPFGRTGETVVVSPDHCEWLTSLGMAVKAEDAGEQADRPETAEEPKETKKTAKAPEKEEPKVQKKTTKKK